MRGGEGRRRGETQLPGRRRAKRANFWWEVPGLRNRVWKRESKVASTTMSSPSHFEKKEVTALANCNLNSFLACLNSCEMDSKEVERCSMVFSYCDDP